MTKLIRLYTTTIMLYCVMKHLLPIYTTAMNAVLENL